MISGRPFAERINRDRLAQTLLRLRQGGRFHQLAEDIAESLEALRT